jgi:hypothetical protein
VTCAHERESPRDNGGRCRSVDEAALGEPLAYAP